MPSNLKKLRRRLQERLLNNVSLSRVTEVKILLSRGVDVNAQRKGYSAPIHVAAEKGDNEILKLLIKAGADVNLREDNFDRTPLFFAKNVEIARTLVQAGAELDAKDKRDQTALFMAIWNNKLPLVEFLVESCGFEVDVRDYLSFTPLHVACSICSGGLNIEIVKFLLLKNAKIYNVANGLLCLYRGHTPIATLLLQSKQTAAIDPEYIQFLTFLLKYSDVTNLNFGGFNDSYVRIVDKNTCLIFLEHVSVLISLGIVIHSHKDFISKCQNYNDHFDKCQNELLVAKSTKLRDCWVTFFNVLTDSKKNLKNYADNEDLVNDFKSTDFSNKFPIYGAKFNTKFPIYSMQEKMEKAIKRRELYDRSCILLSYLLPIFNLNHLIVRDTLDCLTSKKDLLKFYT